MRILQSTLCCWFMEESFRNHSHQFTHGGAIKECLDIDAIGVDLLPGLVETNSVGCPGRWEVFVLCLLLSCVFPLEAGKPIYLLERKYICTGPACGFFHSAWPGCAQTLVFFPVSSRCSAVRFVFFSLDLWREGEWEDSIACVDSGEYGC